MVSPLWVIHVGHGRGDLLANVRSASKPTVNPRLWCPAAIRSEVPGGDIAINSRAARSNRDELVPAYSITWYARLILVGSLSEPISPRCPPRRTKRAAYATLIARRSASRPDGPAA